MKRIIILAAVASLLAALCAGCCPCRKGKNSYSLNGHSWHLIRMMNHDLKIAANQFVFTFADDGKFTGVGACNHISGQYTKSDKGAMTFQDLASTRRMCPDIELEAAFNQILEQTTHYEIDGDMLLLLSNGDMQAVLQAIPPQHTAAK